MMSEPMGCEMEDSGRSASPSGCEATPSAADASSQSRIPNAIETRQEYLERRRRELGQARLSIKSPNDSGAVH